ncbi:unnamed protein product [Paramecium sonneborni]|uniref:Uncharacterized protein n=1 Tax=Paramecium sonneborni TaxID=65129 RepID=A0A8S1RVA3_9CILI|nr:unnamed protein product [Paramecium sonneborni]
MYNDFGQKNGEWVELSKNFWHQSQIIYIGKYKDGKKVGRWTTKTRENINLQFQQIAGGSYDDQQQNNTEFKIGEWVELIGDGYRKYCVLERQFSINNDEITFKGKYHNGIKIGGWNFIQNGQKIGGGQYDQQQNLGIKIGKWIELSDWFCDIGQAIYSGEYQNGKKVGKWNIQFMDPNTNQYTQFGGGIYNDQQLNEMEIKIGQWIEIVDQPQMASQVFYKGEYSKGQKVGRWDIYIDDYKIGKCTWMYYSYFKFSVIRGGGFYEERQIGNSIKRGKWLEICDKFRSEKDITFQGQYRNGKKIGLWQINYKDNLKKTTKLIGCGVYNDKQEGFEIKEGLWVELSDQFWRFSQVSYQGVYKNGIKISKWNTYFRKDENNQDNLIGGGEYINLQGQTIKQGYWIEICDDFHRNKQITYQGEYTNLKKVGIWYTFFYWNKNEKIGGGQYEDKQEDGGIKIGKWIVLEDIFRSDSKVISKGLFERGKKVGKWKYQYKERNKFEYIGGGSYDKQKILGDEIKIGKWIVPFDNFRCENQITLNGEYIKGQKVGRWNFCWREKHNQPFSLIGGGIYDEQQQAQIDVKTGKWIELSDQFQNYIQVIYHGVYRNGFKISKWDVMKRENGQKEFQKVGEKEYNE